MLVTHLHYTVKYTIDGARQRIDQYRRSGELKASAHRAFEAEVASEARAELEAVLAILDGRTPPSVSRPAEEVPPPRPSQAQRGRGGR